MTVRGRLVLEDALVVLGIAGRVRDMDRPQQTRTRARVRIPRMSGEIRERADVGMPGPVVRKLQACRSGRADTSPSREHADVGIVGDADPRRCLERSRSSTGLRSLGERLKSRSAHPPRRSGLVEQFLEVSRAVPALPRTVAHCRCAMTAWSAKRLDEFDLPLRKRADAGLRDERRRRRSSLAVPQQRHAQDGARLWPAAIRFLELIRPDLPHVGDLLDSHGTGRAGNDGFAARSIRRVGCRNRASVRAGNSTDGKPTGTHDLAVPDRDERPCSARHSRLPYLDQGVESTASRSNADRLMIFRTSAVAVCCCRIPRGRASCA